MLITRWRSEDIAAQLGPVSNDQVALLMIALAPVDMTSRINGAVVFDGRLSAGMFKLVAPGDTLHASFRSAVDFVRIHAPRQVYLDLTNVAQFAHVDPLIRARPLHDYVVEQLACSIVNACGGDRPPDGRFLDCISSALLVRAGTVLANAHRRSDADGGAAAAASNGHAEGHDHARSTRRWHATVAATPSELCEIGELFSSRTTLGAMPSCAGSKITRGECQPPHPA